MSMMDASGLDDISQGWERPGRPAFVPGRSAASGSAGLRVCVLGPLKIVRDGVELRARPAGERSVLGLLVLAEGTPVSPDTLFDVLWSGAPPRHATGIVHTYISRLRTVLGRWTPNGTERLSHDSAGYRLELAESELDLCQFRRLLSAARTARAAGSIQRACDVYDQVLKLWYGDPFADVDAVHEHSAVHYLVQERTAAILEYAQASLSAGQHAQVLPHLRALASRELLDEGAHALLMIALAGAGRQGEALSVYEGIRVRLDEQLGIYPGPALREAHARILRQEVPPASAASDAADSSAYVSQDALAGHWAGIPGPLPVCQLPASVNDFTGRTKESRQLAALLRGADAGIGVPIAAISGAPGVGKTALMLHVAHAVRGAFPDGQFYIQMAGNSPAPRDPHDALGELLRAMGVNGSSLPDSLSERTGLFRSLVADREVLVTIDDAATAGQVRPLLPGTAGSAVMVTSRTRLGTLAGAHLLHLDPLPQDDAVEMLSRIVGRERVAADPAATDMLVAACGGLPLALRIVAAKLATRPSWPVSMVTEAVADERRRLDGFTVDDLAVRASISPSYEALDERERRAFRRLGLLEATEFAGWVVATLVGGPEGTAAADVLVSKSLLIPVGTDVTGEPRYGIHDLLRDYAAERLADEPEEKHATALARALTGWLELAAVADHRLPRVPAILRPELDAPAGLPQTLVQRVAADPIAWFHAERLNLAAATRQACMKGMYQLAGKLAAHQATFQFFQARLDDAEQLWRPVISAAEAAGDVTAVARAELLFAPMLAERGKDAEALELLNRCIPVFDALGDMRALAGALHCCAWCADQQNLSDDARDYAIRGLGIARRIGDPYTEMSNLCILGIVTTRFGDAEGGVHMCEEALTLARQMDEPYAEFEALQILAYASSLARRHAVTIDLCHQGLKMVQKLGYLAGEGYMLGPMGDAYFSLGRYEEAMGALGQAQEIFETRGLVRNNAICLLKLALAGMELGQYGQAIPKLEASLPVFRKLKLSVYEQRALAALEQCYTRPVRGEQD